MPATKPEPHPTLRRLRLDRGLTFAELAEKAGLTAPAVHGIETGYRRGKQASIVALAEALEVPLEELRPWWQEEK